MRSTLLPHLSQLSSGLLNATVGGVVRRLLRFSAALAVVLGLTLTAAAQEYNKNKPDQALKADARVDPSTLGMSLGVPLGGAPGRAGMSLPIALRYSSKLWRLEGGAPFTNTGGIKHTWAYPKYSENSVAGWTSSLEPPRIEFTGEEQLFGSTGQPLGGSIDDQESYGYYVRRIHLHLPDGSSQELRKDDATPGFHLNSPSYDFSGVYYAVDGSRTRYDYDAGVLYLPDGSRYHFGARQSVTRYGHAQEGRWGTTYIDRHGNTMTYNTGTGVWTDTLGRTIANPLFLDPQANEVRLYQVPGVNGHVLTYKLYWKSLGDALRVSGALRYVSNTRCVSPTTYQSISPYLFTSGGNNVHVCTPTNTAGNPVAFNPVVLARVELPDGQFYDFKYNVWGEIEQMTAPGGGYERYNYDRVATLSRANPPYDQANRGVVERWVSPSGTGAEEATHHWLYSITKSTGVVTATTTEPDGTRSERLIYANSFGTQYGFETPLAGMSYDERVYNSSNQMLRRTLTGWSTITPPGSSRPRDPHVTKTVGLILDTGAHALSSTTTMAYDSDLNVTAKNSYDYVSINQTTAQTGVIGDMPSGDIPALLRTEETTYLVNDANISAATRDAYRARNMVGLPSSSRVKNAADAIVAQSEVKYDEANYPLLTYGAVVGWTDPGTSARGNATTTRSWLDTSNTWVETHARYDQVGNLRHSWDAKGHLSQVEYSPSYHYAYPTSTTSPNVSNTYLTTSTAYDFATGKVTSTTDANSKTTVLKYTYVDQNNNVVADALDRLRKVEQPDGGWTMYDYGRNAYGDYIRNRTAVSATQSTDAYEYFDGAGRAVRSFAYDGSQWTTSDTEYDAMGRALRTSNPYLSAGSGAPVNPSGNWTTTAYDALGRVSTVTTPDGAAVVTSYSGNMVTVTDQAGRRRKSVTDALGQLSTVYEDPSASGYTGLNYQTNYTYDVLGNLRKVEQGGQSRFYMYDSLSRLVRARNPEQEANASLNVTDPVTGHGAWSLGYSYDANGNLSSRIDARNYTTAYTYDALNRNVMVDYSNTTLVNPDITRYYDGAISGKGRFWHDYQGGNYTNGTAVEHRAVDAYDEMGRPLTLRQMFKTGGAWSAEYKSVRTYNLAGSVKTQSYPSGHAVNYNYDAAGRLGDNGGNPAFNGNLGDGTQRTYSTGIQYDEAGRLKLEQFGTQTALNHKRGYNVRGQMCEVGLGTPGTSNRGLLLFYYSQVNGYSGCASGTDNNGNVVLSQHWVPNDPQVGGWQWFNQYYTYDSLNRIGSVREEQNAQTTTGEQHFTYDRWGNRQINAAATYNNNPVLPFNEKQFIISAATNRLSVPGGQAGAMAYDPAGNLTEDSYTGAGARTYDAENRMTSATTGINRSGYYTYDAEGRRTRRQNSDEAAVWQVYGFDSELLAEYAAGAAPTLPQKEYGYRNGELLVTAEGFGAAASFVKIDTTTQGSWKGKYGAEGYNIVGDVASQPAYVQLGVTGHSSHTWAASTTDVRALQKTPQGSTDRLAAAFYSGTEYTVSLNLTDGKMHRVALYCLDWDGNNGRAQRLEVRDAVSNALLDSRDVSAFSGGKYVVWNLRGHVKIKVMHTGAAGSNAVASALFYDSSPDVVQWLVSDHLGTPRMVSDLSGSLAGIKRHDYLPFGEEAGAGIGGRTQQQGYFSNNLRQGFAGYEKDGETGLNFAQSRYYSSAMGRFTSVDPIYFQGNMLGDPQRFNLYSYVRNNPLALIDPDGESIKLIGNAEERRKTLAALRDMVGKTAGSYLYENKFEIKDKAGNIVNTEYYVGIYKNGPKGNGAEFGAINEVAGELAPIIADQQIVDAGIVQNGQSVNFDDGPLTIGSAKDGHSPGATGRINGRLTILILDPSANPGQVPANQMATVGKDGIWQLSKNPGVIDQGILMGHEMGHARAKMTGDIGLDSWGRDRSSEAALRLEKKVRHLKNPQAPFRFREK